MSRIKGRQIIIKNQEPQRSRRIHEICRDNQINQGWDLKEFRSLSVWSVSGRRNPSNGNGIKGCLRVNWSLLFKWILVDIN